MKVTLNKDIEIDTAELPSTEVIVVKHKKGRYTVWGASGPIRVLVVEPKDHKRFENSIDIKPDDFKVLHRAHYDNEEGEYWDRDGWSDLVAGV